MNGFWMSGFAVLLVLGAGAIAGCAMTARRTAVPSVGGGGGKVIIVYDEAGVRPENLNAFRIVKQSGGLDRVASWVNARIDLPADITVKVTDAVPAGVTDASCEPDGKTVWEPAFFLTEMLEASQKLVPEVKSAGKVPAVLADADFTPEAVLAGATEFIFGHEMGHALMRLLDLPVLSFEEIQADGMAAFLTLNNPQSAYKPAIQAAVLFDEFASAHGAPTVGDYSSDHPIIQSRIYNFLCLAAGSDSDKLRGPLIDSGFVPEERALFCPLQWAQLDHGWWRVLEPHLSPSGRTLSAAARRQAEENYKRRFEEFKIEIQKLREKTAAGG
jgi:hypothetical protein